jgi:lipid II isoglutaminyl synthase (glutamine-hydrolysing)
MTESSLCVVSVYPELLGTYGDRGNTAVLRGAAQAHGFPAEVVEISMSRPAIPSHGDIYVLGGGEDRGQLLAAELLASHGRGLRRAADAGRAVLGVCAGYQLLGTHFQDDSSGCVSALGLLDVHSTRFAERAVGEVVAEADPTLGLPVLTGFENHQGRTWIEGSARPLGRVVMGLGNGDGSEGAYQGHVLGTYLHGPALVRNPALADLLLGWVVGRTLRTAMDEWTEGLRRERLGAAACE